MSLYLILVLSKASGYCALIYSQFARYYDIYDRSFRSWLNFCKLFSHIRYVSSDVQVHLTP